MNINMNSLLVSDAYKQSHLPQYPDGTTLVYSNWTPRSDKYAQTKKGVVVFGIQSFFVQLTRNFRENFFDLSKNAAVESYRVGYLCYFGVEPNTDHVAALHDLGYLPIKVKALPEGSICPIGVPMLTMVNTLPEFFWVTNFLETIMSAELWQPMTSATIARGYKDILMEWSAKTCDNNEHVPFQAHDFSMRGMAGVTAAAASGAGHILSFPSSDTIPAVFYLKEFYNADPQTELVGVSIPATEHSVMSMGTKYGEVETFKRLITEIYPNGLISIVSDTWNLWDVLTKYLPSLKNEVIARDGKVVIRPDSGDPVDIICGDLQITDLSEEEDLDYCGAIMEDRLTDFVQGDTSHGECGEDEISGIFKYNDKYYKCTVTLEWNRHDKQFYFIDETSHKLEETTLSPENKGVVELLWDIFGGTINSKGYKVLDSHIGAVYGDSITLDRADQMCKRLEAKGFASSCIVVGVGSYTYQHNTRDTYGHAMKATYGEVNGVGREIYKDPITDDGTKKSAKGLLKVYENVTHQLEHISYALKDQVSWEEEGTGALKVMYKDGYLVGKTTFAEIKERLAKA